METDARASTAAYKEAREQLEKLKARPQPAANDALIKQVEALAPAESPSTGGGGRGGRGGGAPEPPAPPTLANMAGLLVGAVQSMQAAEMPPTATQLQACVKEKAAYTALIAT